jgi:hypothetical protein
MCAVALAGLAVSAIGADDATPKVSVTVQDGDTLVIKVPAGWDQTQTHSALAPTITMHPKNQEAELKITFIADPKGELGKKDHLEKAVRAAAQQYVKGSVEKANKLQSLDSKNGTCVYAEFTDAAWVGKQAPPGKYKVVATGVMSFGKTAAAFTLLGNSFDDKSFVAGKEILQGDIAVKKE